MNARSARHGRAMCAALTAAGCLTLAPMDGRAAVMLASVAVTDFGAPSSFSFSFLSPIATLTGTVQVTTSIIGVYADGSRNGASVAPTGANLVTGSLRDSGNAFQPVTGVGGAGSFAGAGGAAGTVHMASVVVANIGATPSNYLFSFATPISSGGNVTSQSNLGAALMDFSGDGASVTGNTPAGKIATFAVNNSTPTEIGSSFSAVGLAGSELDSGGANIGCSLAPCTESEIGLDFVLSSGDNAGLIARHEIGGDPIIGTVMQLYALTTQTNVFDCGIGGCDFQLFDLSFVASGGGDGYVFLVRQEVINLTVPVPEPATAALVGLALAGWFATRRRAASTRSA